MARISAARSEGIHRTSAGSNAGPHGSIKPGFYTRQPAVLPEALPSRGRPAC